MNVGADRAMLSQHKAITDKAMKQQQQNHTTTTAGRFVAGTLYTLLFSVDHYAVLIIMLC